MSSLKKIKIFKSKYKKYKKFYRKKKKFIDNENDLFVLRKVFSGTKKPTTESWINLIK